MITDLQELLKELNKEPLPEEVKKNEDNSLYIPISIIQRKLDFLFGYWDWEMQFESIGKQSLLGRGILSVTYPNGYHVAKSGTAGVDITGMGMKMDYPRLEAMCILNAAKKLGVTFGRNLNRDKEDSPLPVTQLRNQSPANEEDESYNSTLELVKEATTKEQALSILVNSEWRYHKELKEIANSKP